MEATVPLPNDMGFYRLQMGHTLVRQKPADIFVLKVFFQASKCKNWNATSPSHTFSSCLWICRPKVSCHQRQLAPCPRCTGTSVSQIHVMLNFEGKNAFVICRFFHRDALLTCEEGAFVLATFQLETRTQLVKHQIQSPTHRKPKNRRLAKILCQSVAQTTIHRTNSEEWQLFPGRFLKWSIENSTSDLRIENSLQNLRQSLHFCRTEC